MDLWAGARRAPALLAESGVEKGRSACTRSATRWCIRTTVPGRSSRRSRARSSGEARVPDDQDPAQRHDRAGPCENADQVGLRRVIGEKEVGVVLKALTGGSTEMPKNWNRRFKHNRDKMKTGDILELAEVVRNLSLRDHEKGLSTGEKQMFVKAKKILASELMYAKDMDEEECAEWLEEVLASAAAQEEDDGEEEGRRRDRVQAGLRHVGLGDPRRRRARREARPGSTEGVREARRGSAPRRASAPPRRSDWIDGIVVVAPPAGRSRRSCSPRSSAAAR